MFQPSISALDSAVKGRCNVIDLKPRDTPFFKPIYGHKGEKKRTTIVDLNVYFDDNVKSKNAHHWPLSSGIREILSNSIDACFQSMEFPTEEAPKLDALNKGDLASCIRINGKNAISLAISVDKVKRSVDFINRNIDSGRRFPSEYIEATGNSPVKPLNKKRKVNEDCSTSDSDEEDNDDDNNDDENSVEEKEVEKETFRIALYVRNIGSAMPFEAWVNNYSSKSSPLLAKNTILKECLIGGFGYGLKDSVLSFFRNKYKIFNIFAYDPLGEDKTLSYRGIIERMRYNVHPVSTLNVKITFGGKVSPHDKDIPTVVRDLYKKRRMKKASTELKSNADLPSTTIMIGRIVHEEHEIMPVVKELISALSCHSVLGDFGENINLGAFIKKELQKDSKAKSINVIDSSSEEEDNEDDDEEEECDEDEVVKKNEEREQKEVIEVDAGCVDAADLEEDPDATFKAEVTVHDTEQSKLYIASWPGLRFLQLEDAIQQESGIIDISGCYFSNFLIRFPASFKILNTRDRVHRYDWHLGALCGSAILAACQLEKDEAGDQFPDFEGVTSPSELLDQVSEATTHLPCHIALLQLLIKGLEGEDNEAININLHMLLCVADKAREYIGGSLFKSFQVVLSYDDKMETISNIAYQEAMDRSEMLLKIPSKSRVQIKIPLAVPQPLLPLFGNLHELQNGIRDLVLQVAFLTPSWTPKYPPYNELLSEFKRSKCANSICNVIEVDLDTELLSALSGAKKNNAFHLPRLELSTHECKLYHLLRKEEAVGVTSTPPTITLVITSSLWGMNDREKIIKICSDGNEMFENRLQRSVPYEAKSKQKAKVTAAAAATTARNKLKQEEEARNKIKQEAAAAAAAARNKLRQDEAAATAARLQYEAAARNKRMQEEAAARYKLKQKEESAAAARLQYEAEARNKRMQEEAAAEARNSMMRYEAAARDNRMQYEAAVAAFRDRMRKDEEAARARLMHQCGISPYRSDAFNDYENLDPRNLINTDTSISSIRSQLLSHLRNIGNRH